MAGNNEQHGRPTNLTPWIIGAVVAIALIWIFTAIVRAPSSDDIAVDTLQSPNIAETDTAAVPPPATAPGDVAAFVTFARRNADEAGLEHEYMSEGIARLAAALRTVAERNDVADEDFQKQLDMLQGYGGAIRRNPRAVDRADTVNRAFMLAAGMMEALQQRSYPNTAGPVARVRSAATAIAPDRPLLEQMPDAENFFRRAGLALQTMTEPAR